MTFYVIKITYNVVKMTFYMTKNTCYVAKVMFMWQRSFVMWPIGDFMRPKSLLCGQDHVLCDHDPLKILECRIEKELINQFYIWKTAGCDYRVIGFAYRVSDSTSLGGIFLFFILNDVKFTVN